MIERLRALVGAQGVRTGAEAAGWGAPGAESPVVVAPDSAEQAAAVLRLATAEGWSVQPAGAGALLDTGRSGRAGAAPDLVLTTERLAGVSAYEPADLVVSAGAGTTVGALRERLAAEGQWLALDPPGGEAATLGAVIANASAGPLREGYGTPRDHVLGLQLVTGDGRIIECGGRVVKNVAGYDLVKLIVGSQGTLGLVTRLDLRLRALPQRDRTLALAAHSPAPLIEVSTTLRELRIGPVALELISPAAWRELQPGGGPGEMAAPTPTPVATGGAWVLLVRLQGNAEAVAAAEERVTALAGGASGVSGVSGESGESGESGAPSAPGAVGRDGAIAAVPGSAVGALAPDTAAEIWRALDRFEAGATLVVRLADRPSLLAGTLETALALPGGAGGVLPIVAHAGAGIVRVLAPAPAPAELTEWQRALAGAGTALASRRGTLLVRRGAGALSSSLASGATGTGGGMDARVGMLGAGGGTGAGVLRLQRGLRERFDPAGTLVPGRYMV